MIVTSRFAPIALTIGMSLLFGLVLSLSGCGTTNEVLTFSRDTQRKGTTLYNEGEYAEAAGAFKNAARQNPRDYRNYYYLGACYEQMGQYQQAVHSYRTAKGIINVSMAGKEDDDFRMRIINGLGRAIARSDMRDIETNAAVAEAEKTTTAESWFIVAKVYAFRGDPDSAIDAYNRAALLEPKNFLIQRDYGLYLDQLGQTSKAITPLRKAYALNSQDEQVSLALRRAGVVPGPSLKRERDLVRPAVPKGPIPELETILEASRRPFNETPTGSSGSSGQSTVEAPRD